MIERAALALCLAVVVLVGCGDEPVPDSHEFLPWTIERLPEGTTRVMGITLGQTTLGEASAWLGDGYKLGLFGATEESLALEAYYGELTLGRLTARIVLNLSLPQVELQAMRGRSSGERTLGESQERRWVVAEADRARAEDAVIEALTYVPLVDLTPEVVQSRFGEPTERLTVASAEHWLYAGLGLDVVLAQEGRDVLQYVPPAQFESRLRAPLETTAPEKAAVETGL